MDLVGQILVKLLILISFCCAQSANLVGTNALLVLVIPLTSNFGHATGFTRGFFSMFTRDQKRSDDYSQVQEFPTDPRGPVQFSANQPQDYYSYPFQYDSPAIADLYQQFPNFPGLISEYLRNNYQHVPSGANVNLNNDEHREGRFEEVPTSIHSKEVESFFTMLSETDEYQCISRLVCEMGADPQNAGDFAQSVNEVFRSLHVYPPGSKVSYYKDILEKGQKYGLAACASDFSECDNESYGLVKNMQTTEGIAQQE